MNRTTCCVCSEPDFAKLTATEGLFVCKTPSDHNCEIVLNGLIKFLTDRLKDRLVRRTSLTEQQIDDAMKDSP